MSNIFETKTTFKFIILNIFILGLITCKPDKTINKNMELLQVAVYETSASGNKLKKMTTFEPAQKVVNINLDPTKKFQTITGFGGSFTESSAHLLNKLSASNRDKILQAYFGEEGAIIR